jgi:hypothetical protein
LPLEALTGGQIAFTMNATNRDPECFAHAPFRRYSGRYDRKSRMIWKPSRVRRLLMVAALALVASSAPALAQQCASPAEARRAVAAGKAVPLSVALQRAGISGQVVRVALCRKGGRAIYRLGLLDRKGGLRQVTIPAN